MENDNTLAEILTKKKELIKLFVVGTVLAFSIGVLANSVVTLATIPPWIVYLCTSIFILVALILLATDVKSSLSFKDKMKGVLFLDPDKNEILEVKDYELSRRLHEVLSAISVESRSIYSEWETSPLVPKDEGKSPSTHDEVERDEKPSYIGIFKLSNEDPSHSRPDSAKLLDEAILFVLLEELSLHLSTYFNDTISDEYIAEIKREDIPGFLLQNRVLNLLTTPIEHRDVFLKAFPNTENRPEGELVSLRGSDGSMYSLFDLKLPKHTHISHSDSGSVRIETQRFELEIFGTYSEFSAVASPVFIGQYLGRNWKELKYQTIEVVVSGRIKPLSLLSSKGWEHYRWIDSFRSRLRSNVDFDTFLKEIHWSTVEPILHSLLPKTGPKEG